MGSVLLTGLSMNFTMLLLGRMCTGVGEAALIALSPPYIIDYAPKSKKTLYLAIVLGSQPVGQAVGYIYGNSITEATGSWNYAFLLEFLLMAPMPIFALLTFKDDRLIVQKRQTVFDSICEDDKSSTPSHYRISGESKSNSALLKSQTVELTGSKYPNDSQEQWTGEIVKNPPFLTQFKRLIVDKQYLAICLGYAAEQFVLGGFSVWGPAFLQELYGMSAGESVYVFGGITVFCGLFCTLIGSAYQDAKLKPYQKQLEEGLITRENLEELRAQSCQKTMAVSITIALIFIFPATIYVNVIVICLGLALGEVFIFFAMGSIGMAIMASVPNWLRSQAIAMSFFFIHLLGDLISPILIGFWNDSLGMHISIMITAFWLIFAVIFWWIGFCLSKSYRYSDN